MDGRQPQQNSALTIENSTINLLNEQKDNFQHCTYMCNIFEIIIRNFHNRDSKYQNKILVLCDRINEYKIDYKSLYLKVKTYIIGKSYSKLLESTDYDFLPKLSKYFKNWDNEFIKIREAIRPHEYYIWHEFKSIMDNNIYSSVIDNKISFHFLNESIDFILENI